MYGDMFYLGMGPLHPRVRRDLEPWPISNQPMEPRGFYAVQDGIDPGGRLFRHRSELYR